VEFVESYLKANSLTALYDSVFIPVIIATETDHRLELLDDEQRLVIEQSLRDIIEDLGTLPQVTSKIDANKAVAENTPSPGPAPPFRVYCLPARADRDELAGAMLTQLLRQQGFAAQNAPGKLTAGELLDLVEKSGVDAACISVVSPSTVIQARYLCIKLRARFPQLKIVIGLWGTTRGVTDAARRLRDSGADEVVTTLEDAVVQLAKHAPTLAEQMVPAPMHADVEERASAYNLPHDVDISQEKEHPSDAPVGTSVDGRYETGEKSATQSAHAHLPKASNRDPEHH
jgi:methylmalonyl-CoA mutase cobalamin-binding subunit